MVRADSEENENGDLVHIRTLDKRVVTGRVTSPDPRRRWPAFWLQGFVLAYVCGTPNVGGCELLKVGRKESESDYLGHPDYLHFAPGSENLVDHESLLEELRNSPTSDVGD